MVLLHREALDQRLFDVGIFRGENERHRQVSCHGCLRRFPPHLVPIGSGDGGPLGSDVCLELLAAGTDLRWRPLSGVIR